MQRWSGWSNSYRISRLKFFIIGGIRSNFQTDSLIVWPPKTSLLMLFVRMRNIFMFEINTHFTIQPNLFWFNNIQKCQFDNLRVGVTRWLKREITPKIKITINQILHLNWLFNQAILKKSPILIWFPQKYRYLIGNIWVKKCVTRKSEKRNTVCVRIGIATHMIVVVIGPEYLACGRDGHHLRTKLYTVVCNHVIR